MPIANELRSLQGEQRLNRIADILQDPLMSPGDQAVACHFATADHWRSGRTAEAVSCADQGMKLSDSAELRAKFRVLKGLAYLDSGAVEQALCATADDPDPALPDGTRAEWLGVRARALAWKQDTAAFRWFAEAIPAFVAAGFPQDAAAMQIHAAILALALEDYGLAPLWLDRISHAPFFPERDILRAQLKQQAGDVEAAAADVHEVRTRYAGHMHLNGEARADYVAAMCDTTIGMHDRAAYLLEKAARKAYSAQPLDMDLIRRIQKVRQVA